MGFWAVAAAFLRAANEVGFLSGSFLLDDRLRKYRAAAPPANKAATTICGVCSSKKPLLLAEALSEACDTVSDIALVACRAFLSGLAESPQVE